jgi:AraC family transcriptional regulator of adaptative response / methylphosphotriester-DNA alkyltransferase methyltransferase
MTEEEKWKVSLCCDVNYDGKFFYGVKTTGIFCRPSCKSKNPKRENVIFFDTAQEAQNYGLRPCKRCRPDLVDFQPQKEAAENIETIYRQFFKDHDHLKEELKKLGISRNRMSQLFQFRYGKTPVEYLNELRISHAKELLKSTQENILQISLESGFESLSTFYTQFRKAEGDSPNAFRQSKIKKEEEH